MSCLFAACVPPMLMVTTYALQRLESVIHSERPSAGKIVARIEQAALTAQSRAIANALTTEPARLATDPEPVNRILADEPGLPTRIQLPSPTKTRFRPADFANSV